MKRGLAISTSSPMLTGKRYQVVREMNSQPRLKKFWRWQSVEW
jgi:hypothetical protein